MIFAFVSLRAGIVGGLPNRNPKRLFSRTSNEISKKAVRFSLEVGRWRKTPRHQLFSESFAKTIKMLGQFVYGGGFQVLLSSHIIPQGIGKWWHSKSVCEQSHAGSNPALSAKNPWKHYVFKGFHFVLVVPAFCEWCPWCPDLWCPRCFALFSLFTKNEYCGALMMPECLKNL